MYSFKYIFSLTQQFRNHLFHYTRWAIRQTFLTVMYGLWRVGLYQFPKKALTDMDQYEAKIKPRFTRVLMSNTPQTNSEPDTPIPHQPLSHTENLDPIFLDRPLYKKVMENPENHLEKEWRRRILYESTPRGNIIMFYDAYKEGFAYYCDQTGLPTRVLNTVAMKYTMTYRCLDFYTDEYDYPTNPSRMILSIREEIQKEEDKKRTTTQSLLQAALPGTSTSTGPSPFVKFKTPHTTNTTTTNTTTKTTPLANLEPTPEKLKNKFLYMGRISNFSMIQKIPRKKASKLPNLFTQSSEVLEALRVDHERIDYKTFKKARMGPTPP
jgi:hypothetical protein